MSTLQEKHSIETRLLRSQIGTLEQDNNDLKEETNLLKEENSTMKEENIAIKARLETLERKVT